MERKELRKNQRKLRSDRKKEDLRIETLLKNNMYRRLAVLRARGVGKK